MKALMVTVLLTTAVIGTSRARAHVPALLPPLKGTPVSSYFLGQIDISRAVYSELTMTDDVFIAHFSVKAGGQALIELLTPVCRELPQYERFQPSALIIRGEVPWKRQGETNGAYVERLRKIAVADVRSSFRQGERPKFFEEFGKVEYWVGGKWRGRLRPGLHAVVVYDGSGSKGVFSLGVNEKEAWTPDLYAYVGEVLPAIARGLCNPKGYSGRLGFD
ncbi:MAG TPA: hypothetical protein VFV50_03325 [Bdellovibrionales bacterium]|nr:hypothetical protein [Bdellovibrionales bacterium]